MKYRKQLLVLLSFTPLFLVSLTAQAQCGLEQSITICDMENVDYDSDGTPEGIINLYDETGYTQETGDFWISTGLLEGEADVDLTNGILRLWQLRNATDQYYFELRNPSCPNGYRLRVNLNLGPYPGIPVTNAFYPVCDENDECSPGIEIDLNLFDTLESKEGLPLPHLNGDWTYTGSLPPSSYQLEGAMFGTTIPNDGGFPVDSEDFTFRYTVLDVDTCVTEFVDVSVTVVRAPNAGTGSTLTICESDIDSWDTDIDLYDNRYLVGEELGGDWEDITGYGAPTGATNSIINFKEVYDAFVASPEYAPGFSCQEFIYEYEILSRSPACPDDSARVTFILYEELKQFSPENAVEEICPIASPAQINLFDLLEFQPGYVYIDGSIEDDFAFWTFEGSTPANGDLNLAINLQDIPEDRQHLGPVTIQDARPGTYRFRYTVIPSQNCGESVSFEVDSCVPDVNDNNPCSLISTVVTIEILPYDYAGQDTSELNICQTAATEFSLRGLLNTDGRIIEVGEWTDNLNGGVVVSDTFIVPSDISAPISYSFTHTTSNPPTCQDEAVLEFTLYPEPNAGDNGSLEVCTNNLRFTLFEQLEGNPDTTGTWFGPFGYTSTDHLGVFDPDDTSLPIPGPGTYVYTVPGNLGCRASSQATVDVIFVDPVEVGEDINFSYCKTDGRVNLFQLLDRNTPRTGVFEDIDSTGALTPEGVVEFATLTSNIYNFRYVLANEAPCNESSLNIAIQIIDLPEPMIGDQEFCILDAARLNDIEVDVLNYNWYETLESVTPILDNPILVDGQILYIANVDANNCESDRVPVTISILNTGEQATTGEICTLDFQDGVSPDGNSQNDTFALTVDGVFNIPEAFPDFQLQIFNRYGTLVYEGNIATEEFRGVSNVSLSNGNDLPSGTYFYIFNPNFENNLPIQGSFYLAK